MEDMPPKEQEPNNSTPTEGPRASRGGQAGQPISRRKFLKGSAKAALGLGAVAVESACNRFTPEAPPTEAPTATPEPTPVSTKKTAVVGKTPKIVETVVVERTPQATKGPEVEATPTAVAYDITGEMKRDFIRRNPDKGEEEAFSVNVGTFSGFWPEGMDEKIKDFLPLGTNPKDISFEDLAGKTKILVDPHSEKARVIAIPWEPEEGRIEILAFFTPLLARTLTDEEVEREIEYLISLGEGNEAKYLHLAAYRNEGERGEEEGRGRIEEMVVPLITKETMGAEKWEQVVDLYAKKQVRGIATGIETREIIKEDGTTKEKDVTVMILFDEEGKELFRVDLPYFELNGTQREEAAKGGAEAVASLDIEGGKYDFNGETVKLWEVPAPPRPEVPAVEGLRAEWEEDKMVYRAEAENPYGLEAGVFAGFYYPEAYHRKKDEEGEKFIGEEEKIGLVGLRPEVEETLLKEANWSNKNLFPIPFDISYAEKPESVQIMEITKIETEQFPQHEDLLFSLPRGSKLVNPFPTEEGEIIIRATSQSLGHDLVVFGSFGVFDEGFSIFLEVAGDSDTESAQSDVPFGEAFPDFALSSSFSAEYRSAASRIAKPDLTTDANVRVYVQGTGTYSGEHRDISIENLLRVGKSPVFSIDKNNPLLES